MYHVDHLTPLLTLVLTCDENVLSSDIFHWSVPEYKVIDLSDIVERYEGKEGEEV